MQDISFSGCKQVFDWYSEEAPQVSIIVLNFNKAQLTIECLTSLWKYTEGYRYEVIVVDNGSHPDDFAVLSGFKGAYKLLRLDVNRYFGEGNNLGAELAQADFLLFMNNDVTVTPRWLGPLMEVFQVHSDCGAAGPKFVYPNGLLQEAGALLDEEGGAVQIGKYQDPASARFNCGRVVDYVSAATVLMRKTTFDDVLGFDFIYEPAYYEDVDLCLKIGQCGLKTYYVPESCVIHHENATTSDLKNGLQLNNIVAINREKFVKRWNGYLKTGRHQSVQSGVPHLMQSIPHHAGSSAAVYTPYNIIPGGGERYLLSIAEALIQAGYQTWLITPEKFSSVRITRIAGIFGLNLQGMGITTIKLVEKTAEFDLFVAMGNEIAPPIKPMGRVNLYCCQFPFPCPEEEIDRRRSWMTQYDTFILYSDFVKENVQKKLLKHDLPNFAIHIVPPPVEMLPFDKHSSRTNIVSVGRFFTGGHCKQQDMLIRAFRRIYELGVNVELHLVGSLPPDAEHRAYFVECQRLAHGLPVHFHLDASSETLKALYLGASIYWHGGGYGVDTGESPEKCEHFGISVVEAMSAGVIPIVVNNGGPASIVQHGVNGFCYDSEDRLIELTLEILFEDEEVLDGLRDHARNRALDFSKDAFATCWNQLLKRFKKKPMDEFITKATAYAEELKALAGFDEIYKLWQRTNIPYSIVAGDPRSSEYKSEVLRVYQRLTNNEYDVRNELTSNLQSSIVDFERGFPWATSNLGVVSTEVAKVVQALRALQEADMSGKRIIEFGAGWGNLAVPLAKAGQNVTVVDIDDGFLERINRIAKIENISISVINSDFLSACDTVEEKFDAVIFQSSFHHCLDFHVLLDMLKKKVLGNNGKIFFFSEPIFERYQFPWGIRFDGESLWAVMFNKWLELGFDQSFFSTLLLESGFFLERIAEVNGFVGNGWRASHSEEDFPFGDWILPEEFAVTFHAPNSVGKNGRFCRSVSRLPGLVREQAGRYRLTFRNFAPKLLNLSLSMGDTTVAYTIGGGGQCIVRTPTGEGEITIRSETFCPDKSINGNHDTRELGVFLSYVATEDTRQ